MIPNLNNLSPYDTLGVQERVDRFCKRSIKKSSKIEGLKLALSMIDLTTLEGQDTPGKVRQLCQKAIHLHDALPGLPHVAAVCVYPDLVPVAVEAVNDTPFVRAVEDLFPISPQDSAITLRVERLRLEDGWPVILRGTVSVTELPVRGIEVPLGPFQANCYLLGCPESREALVIDPGGDAERIAELETRIKELRSERDLALEKLAECEAGRADKLDLLRILERREIGRASWRERV